MPMIYLVLISVAGGYKVFSVHTDRVEAESWRACREHSGDDTALAQMQAEEIEILITKEAELQRAKEGAKDAAAKQGAKSST